MRRPTRLTIAIVVGAFAYTLQPSAQARWVASTTLDKLTDKKIARMESKSVTAVTIHGRTFHPILTLSCVHAADGAVYVGVFIIFPVVVSFADVRMRYRFDGGTVEERSAGASRTGTYYQVVEDGAFLEKLKHSSRLRIDLSLAAINAFMDFNTAGAAEAAAKAQC
jgi:hypothetical protein